MRQIRVFAPAKVNLTLHITGRRDDGYHLLDSLVAFAPVGDTLLMVPAGVSSLTVEGPEAAGVPADLENLALRAAMIVMEHSRTAQASDTPERSDPGAHSGVAITLDKRLPAASGIGGGSSDAAAAIRGALMLLDTDVQAHFASGDLQRLEVFRPAMELGADVPMCLWPTPLRARGIGDRIAPAALPPLPAVLVNPRVSVSTGAVFRALARRDGPPMPEVLPEFDDAAALIDWLGDQRNDMEDAARAIAPEIGTVLRTLAAEPGCGLARMSGSGATCFGLFARRQEAEAAAARIGRAHPEWWVAGGVLGDQSRAALPSDASARRGTGVPGGLS